MSAKQKVKASNIYIILFFIFFFSFSNHQVQYLDFKYASVYKTAASQKQYNFLFLLPRLHNMDSKQTKNNP